MCHECRRRRRITVIGNNNNQDMTVKLHLFGFQLAGMASGIVSMLADPDHPDHAALLRALGTIYPLSEEDTEGRDRVLEELRDFGTTFAAAARDALDEFGNNSDGDEDTTPPLTDAEVADVNIDSLIQQLRGGDQ